MRKRYKLLPEDELAALQDDLQIAKLRIAALEGRLNHLRRSSVCRLYEAKGPDGYLYTPETLDECFKLAIDKTFGGNFPWDSQNS